MGNNVISFKKVDLVFRKQFKEVFDTLSEAITSVMESKTPSLLFPVYGDTYAPYSMVQGYIAGRTKAFIDNLNSDVESGNLDSNDMFKEMIKDTHSLMIKGGVINLAVPYEHLTITVVAIMVAGRWEIVNYFDSGDSSNAFSKGLELLNR